MNELSEDRWPTTTLDSTLDAWEERSDTGGARNSRSYDGDDDDDDELAPRRYLLLSGRPDEEAAADPAGGPRREELVLPG